MSTSEAVLVTGASTGIGKAIVEDLRERGVRVFAAVRDLSSVDDHPLVTPLRLDVTSSDEIAAAARFVAEQLGDSKLRGIVNNAGQAAGGPMEFLPMAAIRAHFDVNVFGQIEVTQAFLPILRDHGVKDPRVIFMGSIASRIAPPFLGPYTAGKHAIRAIGEAMRGELKPWNIHVSVIEPGNISTPIWSKGTETVDDVVASISPRGRELYEPILRGTNNFLEHADRTGIPASRVAAVTHKALFDARPKAEYLVGMDARQMAFGHAALPRPVFEKIRDLELARRRRG